MTQLSLTIIQAHEIIKEGWVQKKRKLSMTAMVLWRPRWLVLTLSHLYTFKKEKEYSAPSQAIQLSIIKSIATNEEKNILCLQTDQYFHTYLKFDALPEMEKWVNMIAGYINIIRVPVVVDCEENKAYSCNLEIAVPFHEHHTHKISQIVVDIVQRVQRQHNPIRFNATKIGRKSFIGKDLYHNNNNFNYYDGNITDYDQQNITTNGLYLSISIADNRCKYMSNSNSLCSIYVEMRDKNICSEESFLHLLEYTHFENEIMHKPECKDGEECESYNRLLGGGNQLKDRCHVKIYRHHYLAPLHTANSSEEVIQKDILKNAEILSQINDKLQAIDITKWRNGRDYAVLQIMTLAQSLEKSIRDVGIAKSSGGGATIIGGGLCLTGAILVPFSGGTSLALSVAGASVMVAGGVTTLGSGLAKFYIEKDKVKRCVEAYESIQADARRIAFLLDDYQTTFSATQQSVKVWTLLRLGASGLLKCKGVGSLVVIGKGMRAFKGVISRLAASTSVAAEGAEDAVLVVRSTVFGGGSFVGKAMGWAAGPLGVAFGIYDIFDGVKTFKDAENAIHKLRLLAIDISDQTEKIMVAYNNVLEMH